ncbi:hypothetical protein G6F46_014991 [Rhizopus delemar]|nr:hypothetical protein G6F46_014991 [Rhizopus delemar]
MLPVIEPLAPPLPPCTVPPALMVVPPAATATDGAAQRGVAGDIGYQCAVVADVTDDRAGRTAIADLQRAARIDGGAAGVGVVCGQHQRAEVGLGQLAGAGQSGCNGAGGGGVRG